MQDEMKSGPFIGICTVLSGLGNEQVTFHHHPDTRGFLNTIISTVRRCAYCKVVLLCLPTTLSRALRSCAAASVIIMSTDRPQINSTGSNAGA